MEAEGRQDERRVPAKPEEVKIAIGTFEGEGPFFPNEKEWREAVRIGDEIRRAPEEPESPGGPKGG